MFSQGKNRVSDNDMLYKQNDIVSRPRPDLLLRLDGGFVTSYATALSCTATVLVISLSLVYDYEESNATHCKVWNFLPSISAATSCCTPQKYIWRVLIGLHCMPRFITTCMYYKHYQRFRLQQFSRLYRWLVRLNAVSNVVEISCLLLLSSVSSTENFDLHKFGFLGFVSFSFVHMILSLVLFYWSRAASSWLEKDQKSYRVKAVSAVVGAVSFALCMYFYFRHEAYCEPGVYSMFAFFEYVVIFSNIIFHWSATYEFGAGAMEFIESSRSDVKYP